MSLWNGCKHLGLCLDTAFQQKDSLCYDTRMGRLVRTTNMRSDASSASSNDNDNENAYDYRGNSGELHSRQAKIGVNLP